MTLSFTVQFPQCVNYDEPNESACASEEAAFDPDALADEMAESLTYSQSSISLDSVSPSSGPVGSTVTLAGSGFLPDNKVLFDGSVAASDAKPASSANGTETLVITVPSSMGADCKAGQACPMYAILVTPKTYSVTVENENGDSNAVEFAVTAQ
jgi:hypothetical protein